MVLNQIIGHNKPLTDALGKGMGSSKDHEGNMVSVMRIVRGALWNL